MKEITIKFEIKINPDHDFVTGLSKDWDFGKRLNLSKLLKDKQFIISKQTNTPQYVTDGMNRPVALVNHVTELSLIEICQ